MREVREVREVRYSDAKGRQRLLTVACSAGGVCGERARKRGGLGSGGGKGVRGCVCRGCP